MGKRLGNVFDAICDMDNLSLAFKKVRRGKSHRPDMVEFQENLKWNLLGIREDLLSGNFALGRYHVFKVYDPKERTIHAAPVRERVIHHAIINLCGPWLERPLIDNTFACRTGKGQWAAIAKAQELSRKYSWCLKLDIKSYFDSIDQKILFSMLLGKFKDPRLLDLFYELLSTYYSTVPGKGLPIGNLTSQFFANFYLAPFDRLASSRDHHGYVRYMDDMLIFGEHQELKEFLALAREFLHDELQLTIKRGGSLQPIARGIDFLGCRVYPHHLLLNRRSRIRFLRKNRLLVRLYDEERISDRELQTRATALYGFASHTDISGLVKKLWET